MTRRLQAALLAAGVMVAGLAAVGAQEATVGRPSVAETVFHVGCGLSFIVVGVVAWSRRPQNRVGLLMTAAGFAWFIEDLRFVSSSAAFTVADYAGTFFYAILAHLFVGFPSGRLRSRIDRAAVVAVYLWVGLGNLGPEVFWAPSAVDCAGCTHNLLAVHRDAHLHTIVGNLHEVLNIIPALLIFGVVLRHWRMATGPGRRAMAPVLWASTPIVLAVIALNAVDVVAPLGRVRPALPLLTPIALMTLPFGFLVGLARGTLSRLAVGRLVVELGDGQAPLPLRDALARTLGDPSLQVAYWMPDTEVYVDADGAPVDVLSGDTDRAVTVLQRHGRPVAAVLYDPSVTDDPQLVDAVGAAAGLAVENERLAAEVRAQLAEVVASRARIVEASDAERRRVERNLHDGAQQRLVNVSLGLRLASEQLGAASEAAVRKTLGETAEQLRCALAELRELAAGIHPAILTEEGLGPALQSMAERAAVPVVLRSVPAERFSAPVEVGTYFVVAEALANVCKHAQAQAATVAVDHRNGHLIVEVADDGVGGADVARGSGLRGLADRVAALNGRLEVVSPTGGGTRIVVELPCA